MTHKNRKKLINLKCWMFSNVGPAEDFFCSLDVLYKDIGIGNKLQFLKHETLLHGAVGPKHKQYL